MQRLVEMVANLVGLVPDDFLCRHQGAIEAASREVLEDYVSSDKLATTYGNIRSWVTHVRRRIEEVERKKARDMERKHNQGK